MAIPPIPTTLLSLPQASVGVLQKDGTLSIPWRRAIQQLFIAAGGSGASLAAIIAELAALAIAVAQAQQTADLALADAQEALGEADLAQQLAVISLGGSETGEDPLGDNAEALLLLALAGESDPGVDRTGFGFFSGGLLAAGELLGESVWGHAITFGSPDAASVAMCDYPAAATAVINLVTVVSGSPTVVGTITFAGGSFVGVVAFSAPVTIAEGVAMQVFAPASADATLANVRASIDGTSS